ncbi:hypothetical protein M513_12386 [Trichuris suis]|uniref:Uncharacterized protein n=1 Tax=Trichuris suis TaxID=68888 RepID=A0A085LP27_9BILA|nr:hypothetical protein M513_12386 [Trichuris suis]
MDSYTVSLILSAFSSCAGVSELTAFSTRIINVVRFNQTGTRQLSVKTYMPATRHPIFKQRLNVFLHIRNKMLVNVID